MPADQIRAIRGLLFAALCIVARPTFGQAQAVGQESQARSDSAAALRPGDTIRLRIWREPDLSGDFQVDESGLVVLPKLGPTRVSGQDPRALKQLVTQSYAEYLKNPSIDVQILRRIQVLGAVKNPGLYPV